MALPFVVGAVAGFLFKKKPGSTTVDKTSADYQFVNKIILSVVSSTVVTTDVTSTAGNTFKIVNNGTIKCNLDFTQTIKSTSDIKVSVKASTSSDIKNAMINKLTDAINNANSVSQGAFSTSVSVTKNVTTLKDEITNIVESDEVSTAISNIIALITGINSGKFINNGKWICPPGSPTLVFNQSVILDNIVTSLMNSITASSTTSKGDNEDSGDVTNNDNTKQQGALDALGSFFSGIINAFTNFFKGPILVICITILVIAVLAFIFRKSISKIAEKKTGVSFGRKIEKMINAIKKM
jgi:hypothetical protein